VGRADSWRGKADCNDKTPEFYTVAQLADLLKVSEMTIYRMANGSELTRSFGQPCQRLTASRRRRLPRPLPGSRDQSQE
jgi:hypothetical protein